MKVPTVVALTNGDEKACIARFGVAPRTTAVPVLPPDATDEAWLAARREGVGASETSALLGVSPFASYFSLWWAKHECWEKEPEDRMKVGTMTEDIVATLLRDRRPDMLICRPGARLWAHHEAPWMLATPDFLGVVADLEEVGERTPDGDVENHDVRVAGVHLEPIECKADQGGSGWGDPDAEEAEVPEHHRVQVVQQAIILGAPRGHLVRWNGRRLDHYVIPIGDKERAEFAEWTALARRFLAEVATNVAPDPDGHTATTETLKDLFPGFDPNGEPVMLDPDTVAEFREADHAYRDAELRRERIRNVVRLRMASAPYAVDQNGDRVATRSVYKRRAYSVAPAVIDTLRKN